MAFGWDPFYIGRGTWGALVVQFLTPGGWITPFVTLLIGILLQLLTAVLVGWGLGVRALTPVQRTLLYASFAAFPYFACQMAFSYVQIAYPLASLLMAGGVLLALAGDARRAVAAVLAMSFATSIYQGSLSVLAPVALLAPLAGPLPSAREVVARYLRTLLAALAGGALYLAAHRVILAISGVVPQNTHYSVTFDWRFWERWLYIKKDIGFLMLGAGDVIPVDAVAIFLLVALTLLAQWVGRLRSAFRSPSEFALRALLVVALVMSPFGVLFLHAGELAPRSSVGVAVIWFVLFAVALTASSPAIRRLGEVSLAVVVLMFVFQDNRMFYSQYLVTQADSIMMARIAERIDQLPLPRDAKTIDVVPIGQYSHPPHVGMPRFKGEVLGYSQFEWALVDGRWYMRALAKAIGVDHYVWHDAQELGPAFQDPALLADRHPWPHRSSVFAHDGYAVVWLGQRREEERVTPLQQWFDSLRRAPPGG